MIYYSVHPGNPRLPPRIGVKVAGGDLPTGNVSEKLTGPAVLTVLSDDKVRLDIRPLAQLLAPVSSVLVLYAGAQQNLPLLDGDWYMQAVSYAPIAAAPGRSPSPITFARKVDVATSTLVESDAAAVAGINSPTPISVVGGEYRVGSGSWTDVAGTVTNGQTVTVRTRASSREMSRSLCRVTVGDVVAEFVVSTR